MKYSNASSLLLDKNRSHQTPWELLVNKNLAELITRYRPIVCAEKRYSIDPNSVNILGQMEARSTFGSVHHATYYRTPVVAKIISKYRPPNENSTSIEEFLTEAGFLCQLSHPNILRCLGLFIDPQSYTLVVEKMECSLASKLVFNSSSIGFKLSAIQSISIDICRALLYLHN